MKSMGLSGAISGKRVRSTIADQSAQKPFDLVKQDFTAERQNQLWVADFTYVATWLGFVYVAFVIDVCQVYPGPWMHSNRLCGRGR